MFVVCTDYCCLRYKDVLEMFYFLLISLLNVQLYVSYFFVVLAYFVGRESVKKVKRTTSFDSGDHNLIVAAGESSQTDYAAFIERQKQLLHEYKSSNVSLPTRGDVRMNNDERTDSTSNMNFNEDHYKNTPPNSDLKNPPPITRQPGLSNVSGKSYHGFVNIEKEDYEKLMQQHQKGRFDTFFGFENVHSRIFWVGKFGEVHVIFWSSLI